MSTKKQSKQPTKKQLIETCEELEKGVECVRGFLEQAEEQMKTLSSDGTIPTEGETCLGCSLQGYAEHNHACMKVIIKENDKLEEQIKEAEKKNKDLADLSEASVEGMFAIKKENEELKEENEKLKEELLEALSVAAAAPSVGEIKKLKEEISDLKSQIPDKKGKKLSPKDKELLKDFLDFVPAYFPGDGEHCNLLKRLLK